MAQLPKQYQWLNAVVGLPNELSLALTHFGVLEHVGKGSNPDIMAWAKEVGVSGWYPDDDVPWCGLFKGINAKRAGWLPKLKADLLSALAWLTWGDAVPAGQEALGDTLIFVRPGGGHVAYYIGEDATHFCILGGNQSNAVTFTWIEKARLKGCRRAHWLISQPVGVKKFYLNRSGEPVSQNEA